MLHNRAIVVAVVALAACSPTPAPADSVTTGTTESGFPYLALARGPIDFGLVEAGSSAEDTLTLANAGLADLHVDDLSSTDASVTVGWDGSVSIAPGEFVDVAVRWTPAAFSDLQSTVQIASNDMVQPLAQVELVGATPDPDIEVTPATWDFGVVEVGAVYAMGVSITNVGAAPLTVTSLDYTTTDADLTIDDATLPLVVPPGESIDLRVTYSPTNAGADAGELTVASDDPDEPAATVQQTGAGVAVYDAFDDFEGMSNDTTHVWQYASAPVAGGELTLFDDRIPVDSGALAGLLVWTDNGGNNSPNVTRNSTGMDLVDGSTSYGLVHPAGPFLHTHPDAVRATQYSVVRFVVPADGTWTVDCAFKSLRYGAEASTDVHVFAAGAEVFEADVSGFYDPDPSAGETYVDSLTLAAGDTIDFAVGNGPGDDDSTDSTGFRATVTLE